MLVVADVLIRCPEHISITATINKVNNAVNEIMKENNMENNILTPKSYEIISIS